jgi:hypothetical protein
MGRIKNGYNRCKNSKSLCEHLGTDAHIILKRILKETDCEMLAWAHIAL